MMDERRRGGRRQCGATGRALLILMAVPLAGLLTACGGEEKSETPAGTGEPGDGTAAADAAYARKVVRHSRGVSAATPSVLKPAATLGAPDAGGPAAEADLKAQEPPRFLSLGCGGELVLAFGSERLTDGEGPDLEIVEITDSVEPTRVDISVDGRSWRTVSDIGPEHLRLDISHVARRGETFPYVRLSDLHGQCGKGAHPGADIDAVRALNRQAVTVREVRFTGAEPPFTPTSFIPEGGTFRIEVVLREASEAETRPVTWRPPGGAAPVELEARATEDPLVYRTAPIEMKRGQ